MKRWELPLEVPEVPKFVKLYVDLTPQGDLEILFALTPHRPSNLRESVTVVGQVKIDKSCGATFKAEDGAVGTLVWKFEEKIILGPKPKAITRAIDMGRAHAQLVAQVTAKVSHVTTHPKPEVFTMKEPLSITFET